MFHRVLFCPAPTFMKHGAGMKLKMSIYVSQNNTISQFKHLMCYFCFMGSHDLRTSTF